MHKISDTIVAVEVPKGYEYGAVGIGFDKVVWFLSKGNEDKFIEIGEYKDCSYLGLSGTIKLPYMDAMALLDAYQDEKISGYKEYAILRITS